MKRLELSHRRPHHRGAALAIILLVVLLILGMVGSLFRLSIIQHNQSRQFELQAQADWLARAGLDRATERLAQSEFTGDTWRVQLEELGSVEVITRVTVSGTSPVSRRITSHVRLAPEFTRTPIHGHASQTTRTAVASTKDTP